MAGIRSFCLILFLLQAIAWPLHASSAEVNQSARTHNHIHIDIHNPCHEKNSDDSSTCQKTAPSNGALDSVIAKLSLRQKVGQMFMFGFMGDEIEDGLEKTITDLSPGAIIVFGRNIKTARQISDLNMAAQRSALKASGLPLLIAVDQEGGDVIRVKTAMPLPSALAIGTSGNSLLAEKAGEATGQLLRALGFNMNLAPVLDVGDPDKNLFIGSRTYGSKAKTVAQMGVGFSTGLLKSDILPTGKHFPGHGRVKDDSHRETPKKLASKEELQAVDLVPFKEMKTSLKDQWAVLLAHVAYPALDPSEMPATFSKPIVDGVLRQEIGFQGLVLTDDIEMAGAFAVKDPKERAIRAVEAGVDMIMVAWNKKLQRELVSGLEKAVKSGRIPESRIDESLRRIILAKQAHASPQKKKPTNQELKLALRNPLFKEVAQAAVLAKLRQPASKEDVDFKLFASDRPILVFSGNRRFALSFRESFKGPSARYFGLSTERPFDIDRVMRSNPRAVGVFYVSGQSAARVLNGVSEDIKSRMLIVTVEPEGVLKSPSSYREIAGIYFRHPQLGKMVGDYYFPKDLPSRESGPEIRMPTSDEDSSHLGYRNQEN